MTGPRVRRFRERLCRCGSRWSDTWNGSGSGRSTACRPRARSPTRPTTGRSPGAAGRSPRCSSPSSPEDASSSPRSATTTWAADRASPSRRSALDVHATTRDGSHAPGAHARRRRRGADDRHDRAPAAPSRRRPRSVGRARVHRRRLRHGGRRRELPARSARARHGRHEPRARRPDRRRRRARRAGRQRPATRPSTWIPSCSRGGRRCSFAPQGTSGGRYETSSGETGRYDAVEVARAADADTYGAGDSFAAGPHVRAAAWAGPSTGRSPSRPGAARPVPRAAVPTRRSGTGRTRSVRG